MGVCEQVVRIVRDAREEGSLRMGRLRAQTCVAISLAVSGVRRAASSAWDDEGQGTTEYAILVGVLVVIAIFAIAAFRGKVQELWDAISSGINGL